MKPLFLPFLPIICAALMCGVTYANSSNRASQGEEPTMNEHLRHEEDEIRARDQKDPMEAHSTEKMNGSRDPDNHDQNGYMGTATAGSRPGLSENHPNQAASHSTRSPRKQVPKHQANTPGKATDFHQTGSSKSIAVPDKVVNHRSLPVQSRNVTALSGQTFKNAHNRPSSMALLGGRANSTRSPAGISGTALNRKP